MASRSAWAAALFYPGVVCGGILLLLYFLYGADTSRSIQIVNGIAAIGFCVLIGAGMLVAYGEHRAAPVWVWLVFSMLTLNSIIFSAFGRFEQNEAPTRLAPFLFAMFMYGYRRLVPETKASN